MAQFEYNAIDSTGESRQGRLDAADFHAAFERLESLGWKVELIRPLDEDECSTLPSWDEASAQPQVAEAVEALAVSDTPPLLKGNSFEENWQRIAREGAWIGPVVRQVAVHFVPHSRRTEWLALAEQLEREQPELPRSTRSTARLLMPSLLAAAVSRSQSRLLADLLATSRQLHEYRSTRLQRLAYPAMVVFAATLLFILFSLFLAPEIENLYRAFETRLPPFTQVVLTVAHLIRNYGYGLIAFAVVILILTQWLLRSANNWCQLSLWDSLPLIGPTRRFRGYAFVSRSLASLMENGMQARQALQVVVGSTASQPLRDAIGFFSSQLDHPESAEAVGTVSANDNARRLPEVIQFALRESSGPLAGRIATLRSMAQFYEQRVRRRDIVIGGVCEVAAIAGAAFFVGMVVSGTYAPLIGLISNLSQ